MNRPSYLPAHRGDTGQQSYYQRHHSALYYAHRVKESLTTRVSKFICTIFLFILFVVGLIAFILWLSLRPHRPRFHLEEFSVPSLTQAQAQAQTQAVAPPGSMAVKFNVTIRNPNHKVEVQYDSIDCAIFYRDQRIGGAPLVTQEFDQDSKSTKILTSGYGGPTVAVNNQRQIEMQRDLAAGSVPFRIEITSVIRFEILSWHSKKHRMHANCPATLGHDGLLLPDLKIKKCPVYFT